MNCRTFSQDLPQRRKSHHTQETKIDCFLIRQDKTRRRFSANVASEFYINNKLHVIFTLSKLAHKNKLFRLFKRKICQCFSYCFVQSHQTSFKFDLFCVLIFLFLPFFFFFLFRNAGSHLILFYFFKSKTYSVLSVLLQNVGKSGLPRENSIHKIFGALSSKQ